MSEHNGYTNRETFLMAVFVRNTAHLFRAVVRYGLSGEGLANWFKDVVVGVRSGMNTTDKEALEALGDISQVDWKQITDQIHEAERAK